VLSSGRRFDPGRLERNRLDLDRDFLLDRDLLLLDLLLDLLLLDLLLDLLLLDLLLDLLLLDLLFDPLLDLVTDFADLLFDLADLVLVINMSSTLGSLASFTQLRDEKKNRLLMNK